MTNHQIEAQRSKLRFYEAALENPGSTNELLKALSGTSEDFTRCGKCRHSRGIALGGAAIGVCEFLSDVRFGSRNSDKEHVQAEVLKYSHNIQTDMRCKLQFPDERTLSSGLMCTAFNLGVMLAKEDVGNDD